MDYIHATAIWILSLPSVSTRVRERNQLESQGRQPNCAANLVSYKSKTRAQGRVPWVAWSNKPTKLPACIELKNNENVKGLHIVCLYSL